MSILTPDEYKQLLVLLFVERGAFYLARYCHYYSFRYWCSTVVYRVGKHPATSAFDIDKPNQFRGHTFAWETRTRIVRWQPTQDGIFVAGAWTHLVS